MARCTEKVVGFPEYVRERIYNHNDSAYKDVEDNNLIQAKEYFGIK